jgi:hypothetical protein
MATLTAVVIEDPNKPGFDVLGSGLGARGHFIHEVMARADEPLSLRDIAEQARQLAEVEGYRYKTGEKKAFATTGEHVRQYLRDKMGYAEQLPDKRWRLTERARQRLATARGENGQVAPPPVAPEVRTVDAKSRVLLPAEFAGATVMIERVGENEIRIRKAVVVPVDEFPFIENQLKPLSDRDRDLFLSLLENPPEPTPALRKALQLHKKRHG